jgi:hypothetical protein
LVKLFEPKLLVIVPSFSYIEFIGICVDGEAIHIRASPKRENRRRETKVAFFAELSASNTQDSRSSVASLQDCIR